MTFLRLLTQITLSLTLLLFITTANALSCPNATDFIHKDGRIRGWSWDLPSSSGFTLRDNSFSLDFFSPGPIDSVFPPDASLVMILSSFTDMSDGKTTRAAFSCKYTLPDGAYFYAGPIHQIVFNRIERDRLLQKATINPKEGIESARYECATTAGLSSACAVNVYYSQG